MPASALQEAFAPFGGGSFSLFDKSSFQRTRPSARQRTALGSCPPRVERWSAAARARATSPCPWFSAPWRPSSASRRCAPCGRTGPPKGLLLVGAVAFEGAQPPYPALSPGPSSRPARGAYRRGHRHVRGPVQHDAEQEAVADSGAGRVRRTGGLIASAHRRVRGKALRYGCAILLRAVAAPSLSWLMHSRGTGVGTVEAPGLDAEKRSLSSSGTRRSGCPSVRARLWS